ncbi:Phosphoribosylglycinamide formyltransferase [Hyella patelloides LEGE 07179]|uniref:Phosphoribosylglycinamide formyltransferase n=1 Tax=Hyella patelloides LEGE 07179 TaxID=945734 RepID=A0A563W0M9_9CYAN|nr:phosphoribosylglycinamide formyltransferase [Hyella patelloides]VEP17177.1 Phosphoribosylglycinamide formyltransferase [Hyella patelloides LEGE 07179]
MSKSISKDTVNYSQQALVSPDLASIPISDNSTLQLGVMASGSGTNFEAVAKAIADGKLNAEIKVLIYNNPDAKAKTRAEKYQIPAVFINHRQYSSREDLDSKIVATMQSYGVDWVIMAGWMRVVTQVLLDGFPHRVINIHPSLLPSFKGIRAIEQALKAKVKITGCTVHFVSLAVDSGEIIMQAAVPILPDDTPESLHQRIQAQEHYILPQAIAIAAKVNQSGYGMS